MTRPRPYHESVARKMLDREGVAAIWQLHLSAAAAHRNGKLVAAQSLIDIADAAELEWLRRCVAHD